MGVDISAWQSGLKSLLGFVTPQVCLSSVRYSVVCDIANLDEK
jgi:hypothetical protein